MVGAGAELLTTLCALYSFIKALFLLHQSFGTDRLWVEKGGGGEEKKKKNGRFCSTFNKSFITFLM